MQLGSKFFEMSISTFVTVKHRLTVLAHICLQAGKTMPEVQAICFSWIIIELLTGTEKHTHRSRNSGSIVFFQRHETRNLWVIGSYPHNGYLVDPVGFSFLGSRLSLSSGHNWLTYLFVYGNFWKKIWPQLTYVPAVAECCCYGRCTCQLWPWTQTQSRNSTSNWSK